MFRHGFIDVVDDEVRRDFVGSRHEADIIGLEAGSVATEPDDRTPPSGQL